MAHQIQLPLEQEGGSLLMTFSRRTPEPAKALLTARLRHLPGMIWDGDSGANPYFAFLAAADYILVTEDSTNMATEAASTGKPVFILKMDGTSLKFRLFHEELESHGRGPSLRRRLPRLDLRAGRRDRPGGAEVVARIGVDIPAPVIEVAAVEEAPKPKRKPRAKRVEAGVEAPAEKPASKPRKPRTVEPKA
jgi:hypothetical protein